VFKDWIHSPDCVIGLFPEWFAPRRPDWPAQVRLTGFPLYDAAAHEPLPVEWARHFSYLPFSEVLPRCAAFVSHGGIGSVSQGFRAGVPQTVRPMGFDQFENGCRAESLGVAQVLPVSRYEPPAIMAALEALATPECAAACRRVADRFGSRSGLVDAAEIVEREGARVTD
jgi:UDP:flavonoid glycosyltransferase YjiC (YdhE family)